MCRPSTGSRIRPPPATGGADAAGAGAETGVASSGPVGDPARSPARDGSLGLGPLR